MNGFNQQKKKFLYYTRFKLTSDSFWFLNILRIWLDRWQVWIIEYESQMISDWFLLHSLLIKFKHCNGFLDFLWRCGNYLILFVYLLSTTISSSKSPDYFIGNRHLFLLVYSYGLTHSLVRACIAPGHNDVYLGFIHNMY